MNFRYGAIFAATTALSLVPVFQSALAADLPGYKDTPYVVMSWQGFYFGASVGAAAANTGINDNFTYVGDPNISSSSSNTNFMGGAQAGYNLQKGHVVFGIEGDIGYLNVSAKTSGAYNAVPGVDFCTNPVTGFTYTGQPCSVSGQYSTTGGLYGDITGRLGYAADRALFYAKGGVAFLNADTKANYTGGSVWNGVYSSFGFDHSETLWAGP